MIQTPWIALGAIAWASFGSLALASPPGVVVVNGVQGDRARAAAVQPTAQLRSHLVGVGLARELSPELTAIVEGAPPRRYRLDLSAARRAYKAFEYTEAQSLLSDATADALALSTSDQLANTLAGILLWRGVVAIAQGKRRGARAWLRGAVQLRPDRVLSAALFPPKVRRAYANARAHSGQRRGKLRVAATPRGAQIAIDNRAASTRAQIAIDAGIHLLVATKPGFARDARLVTVRPGQTLDVVIALRPASRAELAQRAVAALVAARGAPTRRDLARVATAIGASRLAVVHSTAPDQLAVRVYDVTAGKRSRAVSLHSDAAPAAIARIIANRPIDLRVRAAAQRTMAVSASSPAVSPTAEATRWYQRWWVWAAVGAATVGAATVYADSLPRERRLRGFSQP